MTKPTCTNPSCPLPNPQLLDNFKRAKDGGFYDLCLTCLSATHARRKGKYLVETTKICKDADCPHKGEAQPLSNSAEGSGSPS